MEDDPNASVTVQSLQSEVSRLGDKISKIPNFGDIRSDIRNLSTKLNIYAGIGGTIALVVLVVVLNYAMVKFGEDVKAVQQQTSALQETTRTTSAAIEDLQSTAKSAVAEATQARENAQASAETVRKFAGVATTVLEEVDQSRKEIDGLVAKFDTRIQSIDQSLSGLSDLVASNASDFRQLAGRLQEVQSTVSETSLFAGIAAETFPLLEWDLSIAKADATDVVIAVGSKSFPEGFDPFAVSENTPSVVLAISPINEDLSIARSLSVVLLSVDRDRFAFIASAPNETVIRDAQIAYIAIAK